MSEERVDLRGEGVFKFVAERLVEYVKGGASQGFVEGYLKGWFGGCHGFAGYEAVVHKTRLYPGCGEGEIVYPTLGLVGEAGELANKVKKIIRDWQGEITPQIKEQLADELGDVLWYVTALANELGYALFEVAAKNEEKLIRRKENGTIQGEGDDR